MKSNMDSGFQWCVCKLMSHPMICVVYKYISVTARVPTDPHHIHYVNTKSVIDLDLNVLLKLKRSQKST